MQYIKIPGRTYKSSDVDAYEKWREEIREESEAWKGSNEPKLTYTESYACVPMADLEGCIFEPASFIDEEDEALSTGNLKRAMITTKGGSMYSTSWSVKELVKNLIKWGLVNPDFTKEV